MTAVICIAVLTIFLSVTLFSPPVLLYFFGDAGDWMVMANMGQAYGGIIAVLTALNSFGIGATLILMNRQTKRLTLFETTQRQFEVLKISFEDWELVQAVDPETARSPYGRATTYANMQLCSWFLSWRIKEMSPTQLHHCATQMFKSPIAYAWWATNRDTWGIGIGRRELRFVDILNEAWEKSGAHHALMKHDTHTRAPAHPGSPDMRARTAAKTRCRRRLRKPPRRPQAPGAPF